MNRKKIDNLLEIEGKTVKFVQVGTNELDQPFVITFVLESGEVISISSRINKLDEAVLRLDIDNSN